MILILNGPNLNLLGTREPDVYGTRTLVDLEAYLRERCPDADLQFFQSNREGVLIDRLHETHRAGARGVVFNPGGYTHTSVALRDAITAIDPPVVEVHLSNVAAREAFRHTSLLAPVCAGSISGLGIAGYRLAAQYLLEQNEAD